VRGARPRARAPLATAGAREARLRLPRPGLQQRYTGIVDSSTCMCARMFKIVRVYQVERARLRGGGASALTAYGAEMSALRSRSRRTASSFPNCAAR
jgi:hypothetical protein